MNIEDIKKDFPIFRESPAGKKLVYLDSASTTQKPQSVIDAISQYYATSNANVHRGIYDLSESATEQYENVRIKTKNFLNAKSPNEIVFTKNTTEAVNLVAYSFTEKYVNEGDEIIVTELEHHSNFIPWQEAAKRKGAVLKVVPIKEDYTLDMDAYRSFLSSKTKIVVVTAMSNVLGTKVPLDEIVSCAHKSGAVVLVDGAQIAAHEKVDVSALGCDFFVMSAHKMLGPTGVGVLYGKEEILNEMDPFMFGGSMIKSVSLRESVYADSPTKFEAGTPNISGVIGFGAALDYLEKVGFDFIEQNDKKLFDYAFDKFSHRKEVKLFSPPKELSGPVISFTVEEIHPHDIASILNEEGVCIRAGHHCSQPLMEKLGVPATARISFYLYNTTEDIDRCDFALGKAIELFK